MKRMTSAAERRMVPETSRRNRIGHGAQSTPPFGWDVGTASPDVGTPGRDFAATAAAPARAAPSPFDLAAHVAWTRSVCQASKQAAWNRYVRGSPGNS